MKTGDIVKAKAGRDKGSILIVLYVEGKFAYVADGKSRKIEKPKKKNLRHLELITSGENVIPERIKNGEKIGNGTLRKLIRR